MTVHNAVLLTAVVLCFTVTASQAQWQAQPGVPNVDYYNIQLYDDQIINGGGHPSSLRSKDNGSSWDTTYVTVFGEPFPCTLYDVHSTSPQTGVASGVMSLGAYAPLIQARTGLRPTRARPAGRYVWIRDIEFGSATDGIAVRSGCA